MDTPAHTPPSAPAPPLAYLPTYDDELDETAHLGPEPVSLLVVNATLTALQNEDQQLLADPRSEGRLKYLNDVLQAFVTDKYGPPRVDSYPGGDQARFTPQTAAGQLPDSPMRPSNPPEPVYDGTDFEAQDITAHVGPASLSDTSDVTGPGTASVHNESRGVRSDDSDAREVGQESTAANSIHSQQQEVAEVVNFRPTSSVRSVDMKAVNVSSSVRQAAPSFALRVDVHSYHPAGSSEPSGESDMPVRLMPMTPAGQSALSYLIQHCDIPEDKRDIENALIQVTRYFVIRDLSSMEELVQASSSSASAKRKAENAVERMIMKEAHEATGMQGKGLAHRGKVFRRGFRGLLHSLRRGLHAESA